VKSADVDGGSFDVTFRYFCGQLDSPFSPALTVDIE
jgi:serine/threonine-protein kinase